MNILFVDAGNYCRSPAAQTVARTRFAAAGLDASIGSAGLKDKHAGDPPDPRTVAACLARGYALDGFLCREITPDDFRAAALILAMDGDNLAQLLDRRPPDANCRIRLFLGDRDVPDPYFGSDDGFTAMMDQIEAGVDQLIDTIRRGG